MNNAKHITVLLEAAVAALALETSSGDKSSQGVRANGTYIDCTFGRGGHSRLILEKLGSQGRLIAIDRDEGAIAAHALDPINDARFSLHHCPMSDLQNLLSNLGVAQVDGVLMDLGVSSPQLDEAARGFSFRFDAPLDMRMDQTRGETAADWVARADEQDITKVIKDYGEERFAKQIAGAIVAARRAEPIRTTRQLAELVAQTVRTREPGQHPATRTFQAIRIFINQELEEIANTLPQTLRVLAPGGKLVVIAFHSLEDRMVKRFMQGAARRDWLPSKLPVRGDQINDATLELDGRALKPTPAEIDANSRCRSAIMRSATRTHVVFDAARARAMAGAGLMGTANVIAGAHV